VYVFPRSGDNNAKPLHFRRVAVVIAALALNNHAKMMSAQNAVVDENAGNIKNDASDTKRAEEIDVVSIRDESSSASSIELDSVRDYNCRSSSALEYRGDNKNIELLIADVNGAPADRNSIASNPAPPDHKLPIAFRDCLKFGSLAIVAVLAALFYYVWKKSSSARLRSRTRSAGSLPEMGDLFEKARPSSLPSASSNNGMNENLHGSNRLVSLSSLGISIGGRNSASDISEKPTSSEDLTSLGLLPPDKQSKRKHLRRLFLNWYRKNKADSPQKKPANDVVDLTDTKMIEVINDTIMSTSAKVLGPEIQTLGLNPGLTKLTRTSSSSNRSQDTSPRHCSSNKETTVVAFTSDVLAQEQSAALSSQKIDENPAATTSSSSNETAEAVDASLYATYRTRGDSQCVRLAANNDVSRSDADSSGILASTPLKQMENPALEVLREQRVVVAEAGETKQREPKETSVARGLIDESGHWNASTAETKQSSFASSNPIKSMKLATKASVGASTGSVSSDSELNSEGVNPAVAALQKLRSRECMSEQSIGHDNPLIRNSLNRGKGLTVSTSLDEQSWVVSSSELNRENQGNETELDSYSTRSVQTESTNIVVAVRTNSGRNSAKTNPIGFNNARAGLLLAAKTPKERRASLLPAVRSADPVGADVDSSSEGPSKPSAAIPQQHSCDGEFASALEFNVRNTSETAYMEESNENVNDGHIRCDDVNMNLASAAQYRRTNELLKHVNENRSKPQLATAVGSSGASRADDKSTSNVPSSSSSSSSSSSVLVNPRNSSKAIQVKVRRRFSQPELSMKSLDSLIQANSRDNCTPEPLDVDEQPSLSSALTTPDANSQSSPTELVDNEAEAKAKSFRRTNNQLAQLRRSSTLGISTTMSTSLDSTSSVDTESSFSSRSGSPRASMYTLSQSVGSVLLATTAGGGCVVNNTTTAERGVESESGGSKANELQASSAPRFAAYIQGRSMEQIHVMKKVAASDQQLKVGTSPTGSSSTVADRVEGAASTIDNDNNKLVNPLFSPRGRLKSNFPFPAFGEAAAATSISASEAASSNPTETVCTASTAGVGMLRGQSYNRTNDHFNDIKSKKAAANPAVPDGDLDIDIGDFEINGVRDSLSSTIESFPLLRKVAEKFTN
jgi:hypothetical protein